MLKNLLLILLVISGTKIFAQDTNKIIVDTTSNEPMLIGYCNEEAFADTNFAWWWNSETNLYEVDEETLSKIKDEINDLDITIVMGSWCSDSRVYVPQFFKILKAVDYPLGKVNMICVDRNKEADVEGLKDLEINLVPTFIFYKDSEELGRIIEMPFESLEKDMVGIIEQEH